MELKYSILQYKYRLILLLSTVLPEVDIVRSDFEEKLKKIHVFTKANAMGIDVE